MRPPASRGCSQASAHPAQAEVEEAAEGEEAAAALAENEEVKAAKEAVSDAQSVFEAP